MSRIMISTFFLILNIKAGNYNNYITDMVIERFPEIIGSLFMSLDPAVTDMIFCTMYMR